MDTVGILTDEIKAKAIESIRNDTLLHKDTDDWWGWFNHDKGPEWGYDINVFSNDYCNCSDDEFGVSIYNVYHTKNGDLITDFEEEYGEGYPTFYVKKREVI